MCLGRHVGRGPWGGQGQIIDGAKSSGRKEKMELSPGGDVYLWRRRDVDFLRQGEENYSIEIMLFRAGRVQDWVPHPWGKVGASRIWVWEALGGVCWH